jgi:hypothetical protein
MAINRDTSIQISASKYDIYSKLLNIANKYTNIYSEDFLKAGLFGYITESMAMVARDSSFHKTMLYNESFLNTAMIPKSIYNWAKMFNINITSATPAYADLAITISTEDIDTFSKIYSTLAESAKYGLEVTGSGNREMIILDRENPFLAGDFTFMLEKSILIYRDTTSTSNSSYIIKYCETEQVTTLYNNPESFFIKSSVTRNDGFTFLTFKVRVYQYTINKIIKQINSSSFLDTKIHKFTFPDQFVGAKLRYRKGIFEENIELRFSNIGSSSGNKFGYYNLIDTNKLQLTFSSATGDFIPSSNSTLLLDMYTTRGSRGNIVFSGDVIFRLKEESLRNLPVVVSFVNQEAIGGVDSPSLARIKNTIINEISTRDVIVTESDLNDYFLILTALLESVNDGRITFVKKRDDILRRVFSAYVLLRDGLDINENLASSDYVSYTVPTNTVTADFQISGNISKPFGTIIKRKSETLEEYEYVPSNALDGSDDYYIIPFYTRVTLVPFKKVKYIYNLTDDNTGLSYKNITSSSTSKYVIPSTTSVKRGLEGTNTSKFYNFEFNFITNFNMAAEVSPTNDEFRLSFFAEGSSTASFANVTFFKGQNLTIESIVSPDDETLFDTKMIFSLSVDEEKGEFNFSSENSTNDYGTFINLVHSDNTTLSLPEDVKVGLLFNNILVDNISIDFISDSFLSLFRNLDEIMYSDIDIKTKEVVEGEVTKNYVTSATIKDIPVVHASFFKNELNQTKFIKQLFTYIDILKDNLGKLETNTFFDLKFYNTYGESQYYNTLRTDVDLEFDVYVVEKTTAIESAIRDYIRLLIDEAGITNSLKISNIIKNLTNTFSIIDHIEFKGLNGTFNQYVREKDTLTRRIYAPEYLNIPRDNLVNINIIQISR